MSLGPELGKPRVSCFNGNETLRGARFGLRAVSGMEYREFHVEVPVLIMLLL